MMLEEVKQFLEGEEGKAPEVSELLSSYATLSQEKVQNYVDTVPEAKAWLDSVKDKHLQKGLETWKVNHLDTIINDEIGRRFRKRVSRNLKWSV